MSEFTHATEDAFIKWQQDLNLQTILNPISWIRGSGQEVPSCSYTPRYINFSDLWNAYKLLTKYGNSVDDFSRFFEVLENYLEKYPTPKAFTDAELATFDRMLLGSVLYVFYARQFNPKDHS
jgi:hypothetical protein